MTKNERIARRLLEIKAEFHDSPTVGKLIAAWKTYLDEQYPIPEDLEAAVRGELDKITGLGCMADNYSELKGNLSQHLAEVITEAVAPFCQKPEVPESLEAAVRLAIMPLRLGGMTEHAVIDNACSAVASLVADKDKRIKELKRQLAQARVVIDELGPTEESPDDD